MQPWMWVVGGFVTAGVVAWRFLRSLDRWTPVQGKDPEAQQAQARLWSTLNRSRY